PLPSEGRGSFACSRLSACSGFDRVTLELRCDLFLVLAETRCRSVHARLGLLEAPLRPRRNHGPPVGLEVEDQAFGLSLGVAKETSSYRRLLLEVATGDIGGAEDRKPVS